MRQCRRNSEANGQTTNFSGSSASTVPVQARFPSDIDRKPHKIKLPGHTVRASGSGGVTIPTLQESRKSPCTPAKTNLAANAGTPRTWNSSMKDRVISFAALCAARAIKSSKRPYRAVLACSNRNAVEQPVSGLWLETVRLTLPPAAKLTAWRQVETICNNAL